MNAPPNPSPEAAPVLFQRGFGKWSDYRNEITVVVADVGPAVLRIVNDLPNMVAGENDWLLT